MSSDRERILEPRVDTLAAELEACRLRIVELEAELARAGQSASAALGARTDFLANLSHELRTPLNAIIGYSEMLIELAGETGESAEFRQARLLPMLANIHRAGKRLLELIDDILDISKLEAGRMELFLEQFDVSPLIDEVLTTIQPMVDRNGNELTVAFENAPGLMLADPAKVRQSLYNLLGNACKFTRDGRISLKVERQTDGSGREEILFIVSDTGIGLSPEESERIFEPFVQADSSTTRRFGGTGLGLSICRNYCRMMGGEVTVSSRRGEGSTFTMRLPCAVSTPDR